MCLIIASSTGKRIPDDVLEDAARTNSHGGGVAWLADKKIRFKKGLTVDEVKVSLDTDVKGAPWVVHFRIATVGGVTPLLTHPFTIDREASVSKEGEADSVLFQNGTFGTWKETLLQAAAASGSPLPEAPWSDSRALAFCCGVYGKHFLSLLDSGSRFLVFDAKEEQDRRMMLWGTWEDHDGAFKFSNRSTCAFYHKTYSQQSRGGGSENFQQGGDAGSEKEKSTSATSPQITDANSPSPTSTLPASQTKRRFSPRPGHDYWKRFTSAGLNIVGANEGVVEEPSPVS